MSRPGISWRRFFGGMSRQSEVALARYLADLGISLGEYMELMEEACIDASRGPGVGASGGDGAGLIRSVARQRLQRYAREKRRFGLIQKAGNLLQPPFPIAQDAAATFWMIDPADRESLREQNRRRIRAMRNRYG